jgi:glycosyltransferase involved in cell wall biosynthesis
MSKNKNLLIATSTFPRWLNDETPPFVKYFSEHISEEFNNVYVLAPHYKNAKTNEKLGTNIHIKRFHYFFPSKHQTIAYSGGAIGHIKKTPLYSVKLLFFMVSLLFSTINFRLIKNTRTINPHWLIPQGFIGIVVKLLTFNRTKVIITIHGGDVFSLNGNILLRFKRFTLKRADAVIVNSSATQKACQEIYSNRKYPIIPMGIDTSWFNKQNSRSIVDNSQYDIVCLFVGRLNKDKGVIYACKAIAELVQSGLNPLLMIAGSGPEEATIRELITKENLERNIRLVGWVENKQLIDYYGNADVFVGPSIVGDSGSREALGLVFLEALSCETPVITTTSGGTSDFVKDGFNGYLVQQKSSKEISDKIKILIKDKAKLRMLSKNSRRSVEDNFEWSKIKEEYLKYL